jgi:hypothetical protein
VFYLLRTANNVQEFLYFVTFSFVPFGIASLLPSPQAGGLPLVGCDLLCLGRTVATSMLLSTCAGKNLSACEFKMFKIKVLDGTE